MSRLKESLNRLELGFLWEYLNVAVLHMKTVSYKDDSVKM